MLKKLYGNSFFNVFEKDFVFNKNNIKSYIIKKGNVVGILPILNGNKIVLEKQYRVPSNRYLYEIPAGHIEENETPIEAAKRELKEETGYTAKTFKKMYNFYSSPGLLTENIQLFVATGLKHGKRSLDKDEDITIKIMSFDKVVKMLKDGKINDAKTIIAILYIEKLLKNSDKK